MQGNKNRKSIISMLVMITISLSVFSVGTSAHATDDPACANSNICAAPALGFKLATSFVREMITAIKTVGTNPPYLGSYVSPSRFQAGDFVPPKEGLVGKFTRNIRQKLNTILAVGAVFTDIRNFGGVKDFAGGFIVLFRNKVFLRDYKTLTDLDSLINDKKYELGLGGGWMEKLTPANRDMFDKIIEKYTKEWLFDKDSTKIEENVTYRQIIMLMARINSSLKTFIATQIVSQFKDEFTKGKLIWEADDIQIAFKREMMSGMKADYQCARGLTKCDDTLSKFGSNISKIVKTFGSGSVDVGKTFADAKRKLSVALWGAGWKKVTAEEKAAIQKRNQELVRNQNGLQTVATGSIFGLEHYRSMLQNAGKKISDGRKDMGKDIQALGTNNQRAALFSGASMSRADRKKAAKEVKAVIKNMKKEAKGTKKATVLAVAEALDGNVVVNLIDYNDIKASMDSLFVDASNMKKSSIISDNVDVTYQFAQVFKVIRTTIDDIIWNRNKENSLVKNLWDACKAQCANIWWKCFY